MNGFTKSALHNGAKIEFETEVFSIETKNGKVKSRGNEQRQNRMRKGRHLHGRVGEKFGENRRN